MILKKAEMGLPVGDLLRKHNISRGIYYRWNSQYSGMEVYELRRLKELENENMRPKKIVAEQALSIDAVKGVNSKNFTCP